MNLAFPSFSWAAGDVVAPPWASGKPRRPVWDFNEEMNHDRNVSTLSRRRERPHRQCG